METIRKELINELQEIIEKNKDAEKGYSEAAKLSEDSGLQSYFNKKSAQRKEFIENLRVEMAASFDEADDGSCKAHLHRKWMDIKAFLSDHKDHAILEESIRGDKASVEEYEKLLNRNSLPPRITKLIEEQLAQIKVDLETSKNFKKSKNK